MLVAVSGNLLRRSGEEPEESDLGVFGYRGCDVCRLAFILQARYGVILLSITQTLKYTHIHKHEHTHTNIHVLWIRFVRFEVHLGAQVSG